jgi:asparagine synthetase B (glutamine-hydrolysing)
MTIDIQNINSFLLLGYYLNYSNPNTQFDFAHLPLKIYRNATEEDLLLEGMRLWTEVMKGTFQVNCQHLVPLSGGLDSRLILASLLEHTEARNVSTYTFGSPGTYDYEIGNKIANTVGTNHTKYPLTAHEFSLEEEIQYSRNIDHQTILFYHPPVLDILERFKGFIVWSGFGGDNTAGSHLPQNTTQSLEDAQTEFIERNQFVRSIDLTNIPIQEIKSMLLGEFVSPSKLTYLEQLDYVHRQAKYIYPHVLMRGFNYMTPFLSPDWINFMLSIENRYRKDTYLYKKIILRLYPQLFKHEVSNNYGLALNAPLMHVYTRKILSGIKYRINRHYPLFENRDINYLDFNSAIRQRPKLRKLIRDNINDLRIRNIIDWIDIEKIWNRHIQKQADHADALIVLASLEIQLKAGRVM